MKIHKIRETNADIISNTVFERIAATIAQPAGCFVGFTSGHSLHTIDGINKRERKTNFKD